MQLQGIALAVLGAVLAVVSYFPLLIWVGGLERFGPCRGARPQLRTFLKGLAFQLVAAALISFILACAAPFTPHFRPRWPALNIIVVLLISDFLHYWEHRLEHLFFWRIHAVHHSSRDLSASSGFHHFASGLLFTVIYGVPISVITRDPKNIFVFAILYQLAAIYSHSPTKLSIGPLNYIFIDNRLHRIHHSIERQHFDKNFGAVLTIWDWIFGTMHRPAPNEWPDTGVADCAEVETITDFLLRPFARRRPVSLSDSQ